MQVIGKFEAAKVAKGPVRDHRPLCLNLDDHMRVCSVVKTKASNYRSFPGVVTHSGPSKLPLHSIQIEESSIIQLGRKEALKKGSIKNFCAFPLSSM